MENSNKEYTWYEGDDDSTENEVSFTEYDISASPNDFNINTLYDFINSGIVKIPGFQRNYVWDIKRASKLIESIILGIPIPQIFLYEEAKNKFLVIDGQQRYMTIYYFKKKRFPKEDKRLELRQIFDENKGIPEKILYDNEFFYDFNLHLPEIKTNEKNKFDNLNYATLDDEDKATFDLRTIRNVIIKQNSPDDGNSVIFEIFNRLNTGGINLKPQEIRTSLFHSPFYDLLYKLNLNTEWRKLTPSFTPDLHMKDFEILLRGFAMLIENKNYKPSMTKFLNKFSFEAKKYPKEDIEFLEKLFINFVTYCNTIDNKMFFTKNNRFNISVFESIFVTACETGFINKTAKIKELNLENIKKLKEDQTFINATISDTAGVKNVRLRITTAKEIL